MAQRDVAKILNELDGKPFNGVIVSSTQRNSILSSSLEKSFSVKAYKLPEDELQYEYDLLALKHWKIEHVVEEVKNFIL